MREGLAARQLDLEAEVCCVLNALKFEASYIYTHFYECVCVYISPKQSPDFFLCLSGAIWSLGRRQNQHPKWVHWQGSREERSQ